MGDCRSGNPGTTFGAEDGRGSNRLTIQSVAKTRTSRLPAWRREFVCWNESGRGTTHSSNHIKPSAVESVRNHAITRGPNVIKTNEEQCYP